MDITREQLGQVTSDRLTEMHMELVKLYEDDDIDAAYTVLEMAKTMVDLAMKILSGMFTVEEFEQWYEIVFGEERPGKLIQ